MLDEMSLGLARLSWTGCCRGTGGRDRQRDRRLLVEQHVHLALKIADRGYILSTANWRPGGSAEQLSKDSARSRLLPREAGESG